MACMDKPIIPSLQLKRRQITERHSVLLAEYDRKGYQCYSKTLRTVFGFVRRNFLKFFKDLLRRAKL